MQIHAPPRKAPLPLESAVLLPPPPTVWHHDFNIGNVAYRVELDPSQAEPLRAYRGKTLVASIAKKEWTPWKLDVADADGDGALDFAIGIVKPTRFLKDPHSTVFFYTFDGKKFSKKWLASTLGRPLVDYCLLPTKTGTELWTLERTFDGKYAVSHARWTGFGFAKEGSQKVLETAEKIVRYKATIAVVVNGKVVPLELGGLQ